jgi:hypothetical protein
MLEGKYNMYEIAMVGYNSLSSFSNIFKKGNWGCSDGLSAEAER